MIDLYTAPTPNGWKISILLEELGLPYRVNPVNLTTQEQKRPDYLKLNPNGRIPTIVDDEERDAQGNGFAVFESGAILFYLAEKHGRFLPADRIGRSTVMQWVMFQMAGVGPMQGQANVFFRYWHEKYQPAIDRYQHETKRLYKVLEARLEGREWLCGEYSIADIATFPWVHIHGWAGVTVDDVPNVRAWLDRMRARPAVHRGLEVPGKLDPERIVEASKTIVVR